jgi:hypothetical protein
MAMPRAYAGDPSREPVPSSGGLLGDSATARLEITPLWPSARGASARSEASPARHLNQPAPTVRQGRSCKGFGGTDPRRWNPAIGRTRAQAAKRLEEACCSARQDVLRRVRPHAPARGHGAASPTTSPAAASSTWPCADEFSAFEFKRRGADVTPCRGRSRSTLRGATRATGSGRRPSGRNAPEGLPGEPEAPRHRGGGSVRRSRRERGQSRTSRWRTSARRRRGDARAW